MKNSAMQNRQPTMKNRPMIAIDRLSVVGFALFIARRAGAFEGRSCGS
jgi:hypothetical protein